VCCYISEGHEPNTEQEVPVFKAVLLGLALRTTLQTELGKYLSFTFFDTVNNYGATETISLSTVALHFFHSAPH